MIGSQGREMKSTVMTSRLGTETAWRRSRLSHMWNCSCLWHLRLLDTGCADNSVYDIELAFFQNTLLFVEIYQPSNRHVEAKKMGVIIIFFPLTIITKTRILKMLFFLFVYYILGLILWAQAKTWMWNHGCEIHVFSKLAVWDLMSEQCAALFFKN